VVGEPELIGGGSATEVTPEVFGDAGFRALVVAHAITAVVLAGAQGHVAALAIARLRGRDVPSARLDRHLRTSAAAFAVAFAIGLLAYPHYRYHVRGLVLDAHFPWASNLFDLKENAAALAVPLIVAAFAVERGGQAPRASAWLLLAASSLLLFVIVSGLIVTTVRGA
jgi:hypothetical protein